MTRERVTVKDSGPEPDVQALRRAEAFRALFNGEGSRDDADIVLTHLLAVTKFYEPMMLDDWMRQHRTTVGFELACALSAARAEPVRIILNHLELSDAEMAALQQAARKARS